MIKRFFLLAICVLLTLGGSAQYNSKLSLPAQEAQWFRDARFGIFVHWGLYSILEGSYKDRSMPDKSLPHGNSWYAEWIQMRLEVPNDEYQALAKQFNPTLFDADAWIAEVKNAGAKYFVITSKHHDGFALWNSKVSSFNIMNTPFKRDILQELVKACKKHGIKYGFYYSHWQDWEHPQGALPEWKEERTNAQFEQYWQSKCLPQVKELLTNFDPDLLWFDTWGTEQAHITTARRDELIALVRANSKKCLINGRIAYSNPGDNIDFLEMNDNSYPDKIIDRPWQTPATINHTWGWHAGDFNWRPSSQMLTYLVSNTSKGGNYLLNLGPKPDGTIPQPSIRRLREMGAWLYANGEAVYGALPVALDTDEGVILTQKNVDGQNYLYATITKPTSIIYLPIEREIIIDCKILESDMPIAVSQRGGLSRIVLPNSLFANGVDGVEDENKKRIVKKQESKKQRVLSV